MSRVCGDQALGIGATAMLQVLQCSTNETIWEHRSQSLWDISVNVSPISGEGPDYCLIASGES